MTLIFPPRVLSDTPGLYLSFESLFKITLKTRMKRKTKFTTILTFKLLVVITALIHSGTWYQTWEIFQFCCNEDRNMNRNCYKSLFLVMVPYVMKFIFTMYIWDVLKNFVIFTCSSFVCDDRHAYIQVTPVTQRNKNVCIVIHTIINTKSHQHIIQICLILLQPHTYHILRTIISYIRTQTINTHSPTTFILCHCFICKVEFIFILFF